MDILVICTKCGESHPPSDFYKDKKKKNGLSSHCRFCSIRASTKWIENNRKRFYQNAAARRKKNPDKFRAERRQYYHRHAPKIRANYKRRRDLNPSLFRERANANNHRLRKETLLAYGNTCQCCGESHQEFLTIDHVNGGGRKHMKEIGGGGTNFYRWLRRHGFPQDSFRLLCLNCNASFGHYGYCPHERENLDDAGYPMNNLTAVRK